MILDSFEQTLSNRRASTLLHLAVWVGFFALFAGSGAVIWAGWHQVTCISNLQAIPLLEDMAAQHACPTHDDLLAERARLLATQTR